MQQQLYADLQSAWIQAHATPRYSYILHLMADHTPLCPGVHLIVMTCPYRVCKAQGCYACRASGNLGLSLQTGAASSLCVLSQSVGDSTQFRDCNAPNSQRINTRTPGKCRYISSCCYSVGSQRLLTSLGMVVLSRSAVSSLDATCKPSAQAYCCQV